MSEPLDIENADELATYLAAASPAPATPVEMRVLAGGVSNRTVLVAFASGETWVLKQALPKLRVAVDWFCDPARIHREAMALDCLQELLPPGATPRLIFEDEPRHILAMAAVPEPHHNWKHLLLAGRVDGALVDQFAGILAAMHRGAAEHADELAPRFEDRTFFHDLRLEAYYAYTATQVPEAAGFLRALIDDCLATRQTLVHGDFSPKNILVHDGRLVLLDHEVIHWGDPAFDLGFAMTHLLSKAHHLAPCREAFAGAARRFWRGYRDGLAGGRLLADDLPARVVRHTLGCLLARVAGRSPLEYMSPPECERQRRVVVDLMGHPPATPEALTHDFIAGLD